MISRLDKVVLRDVLLLTLVCVIGLTFLFSALSLYQIVNRFEVTPHISTLISFAPSLAVSLLPLTMPISALFGTTLVFGRMCAERELLLLAASGVNPIRPFFPLLAVGLIAGVTSWLGVSEFGPQAYAERHNLQRRALADFIDHPPQGPRELRFPGGENSPSIDITYQAFDARQFEGLTILVYNDEGLLATLHAETASITYERHSGTIILTRCFGPRLIQFEPKSGKPFGAPLVAERVNELRVPFNFGADTGPDGSKVLGTADLFAKVSEEQAIDAKRRGASAELVRRAGLAMAGLLLPLLGALLAALVNHPNRLFAVGIGVIPSALGYYPLMTAASTLAEKSSLNPWLASLLAPLAVVAACAVLGLRAMRGRWL